MHIYLKRVYCSCKVNDLTFGDKPLSEPISRSRDYVYGIWQYLVFSVKKYQRVRALMAQITHVIMPGCAEVLTLAQPYIPAMRKSYFLVASLYEPGRESRWPEPTHSYRAKNRATSQYEDRFCQVWGSHVKDKKAGETVLSLISESLYW